MTKSKLRGHLPITVDGEGFTLVFDYNALCLVQEKFGDDAMGNLQSLLNGPRNTRAFFSIGMSSMQPEMSEEDVGRLLTAIVEDEGMGKITEYLEEALAWAFPKPAKKAAPKGEGDRPPRAAAAKRARGGSRITSTSGSSTSSAT